MREAPSRRRAPARPVLRPDALADRLTRAVSAHGLSDRITVPMTALCTAVFMLGAPDILLRNVLHGFATGYPAHTAEATRQLWREMVDSRPFLAGRIDALVGWLDQECFEMDRSSPRIEALTECFAVLDRIDLPGTASHPGVAGELLGPTYSLLRSTGSVKTLGAFYTPMTLSMLIAAMTPIAEGAAVAEPACGAGGMVVATAKVMRRNGLDPTTCSWVLNDVDPLAVALAGVNCVVHGLGLNILLCQGNGLLLGTGLPDDPLTIARRPAPADGARRPGRRARLPASARAVPLADSDRQPA